MSCVNGNQCIHLLSENNRDNPNLLFSIPQQSRQAVLTGLSDEQTLKAPSKKFPQRSKLHADYITGIGFFGTKWLSGVLPAWVAGKLAQCAKGTKSRARMG